MNCITLMCAWMFLPSFVGDDPVEQSIEYNQEVELVEILSEPEDNRIHEISLGLNESEEILRLVRRSTGSENSIAMSDIINSEVVLAVASGKNALMLKCPSCSINQGGTLIFTYLTNGLDDSYASIGLQLTRDDAGWLLRTENGITIENLNMKSRKIFGQVVGIKEILINSY